MINLRAVYRQAEEHTTAYILGLFALLGIFIVAQSVLSPYVVLSLLLTVAFLLITYFRPLWTVFILAAYLPFESFILKFTPDEIYVFARYFSESLIYLLCLVVVWRVVTRQVRIQQTVIDLPFVLFVVVLVSSALINAVEPTVAILGLRQILRFVLVFFIVANLRPSRGYVQFVTSVLFGIVCAESAIGIMQSLIGAPLDEFLLPYESRTFGDITLTSGVVQFWDAGTRIFATLGRYDRLGNFLYFFLLIAVGYLYEPSLRKTRWELWPMFVLGLPALVLTYSRASWFAFIFGFLFICMVMKRDRRVMAAFLSFVIIVGSYLAISGLNVRFITEAPGQTLVERFYETFSAARWRGEYYGYGRVYWFVQTPLAVVAASPIFGFGPGQFGGGAAAALHNTRVYEQLGLPFGVFGTDGYIDNNWFSLWGESGTLGMVFYLWGYLALFVYAVRLYRSSNDPMTRAIAIGYAAAMIGVAFNAFTSTLLEIRTLAFYLWLYGGFVVAIGETKKHTHADRASQ